MKNCLLFILFCVFINAFGQDKGQELSKVIDSLEVLNTSDTYTLYLPKAYDKKKLSAIVFIFEPAARGKVGIQPFIEAAEKYNYILVCSNNCRNGPFDDNFERIDNLFETIFNTYSIDENLIYTAGFSGGSRLACTVAVLTKQIQGVIGCGAGFSPNLPHLPTDEKFSYVGLVGDADMNYQEMFEVKKVCTKFKISHEIFTYDDDHSWPPPNQILRAFDWLELEAYKKDIKPVNDIVVNTAFKSNYDTAKLLENDNLIELAVWEYERIIKNYSRYFNLDSIIPKIKELKNTKLYKSQIKTRERVKDEETKVLDVFIKKFDSEFFNGKSKDNYKWWKKEFSKMKDKYVMSDDIYLKKMGERVSFSVYAMAIETARNQLRLNKMDKAVYCHTLNTVLFPDRPYAFYLLAVDYALLHEEEKMLQNLKTAIEKGFTHKDFILNTKEFSNYANNESFLQLVNSI
jgi:predicted esterase